MVSARVIAINPVLICQEQKQLLFLKEELSYMNARYALANLRNVFQLKANFVLVSVIMTAGEKIRQKNVKYAVTFLTNEIKMENTKQKNFVLKNAFLYIWQK